jgi:hypothetical protein
MTTIRRAAILKRASAAYEMDLSVASGVVTRDKDGRWRVGAHDLDNWLTAHEGEESVLVLGSLEDDRPVAVRTCGTCGRDYTEIECPYCRASRIRLRGQP